MALGQTPHSEIRLRQQIVKLKELRAKDATELSQLRTDVEHPVRAVNQLTAHNRQLLDVLLPCSPPRSGRCQCSHNRTRATEFLHEW
ncbi:MULTISPECIES: hypothetical protein [Streptomyces]|uniref:hypothetical protein n=1 Tax=Streptomyces TaxID=1883 RepID=UPI0033AB1661